jgi:hypothetical protein
MSNKSRIVIYHTKNKKTAGHQLVAMGLSNWKFVNLWRTHGDLRSVYGEIRQLTPGEPMVTLFE